MVSNNKHTPWINYIFKINRDSLVHVLNRFHCSIHSVAYKAGSNSTLLNSFYLSLYDMLSQLTRAPNKSPEHKGPRDTNPQRQPHAQPNQKPAEKRRSSSPLGNINQAPGSEPFVHQSGQEPLSTSLKYKIIFKIHIMKPECYFVNISLSLRKTIG